MDGHEAYHIVRFAHHIGKGHILVAIAQAFHKAQEPKETAEARGLIALSSVIQSKYIRTAHETIRHGTYIVYIVMRFVNIP